MAIRLMRHPERTEVNGRITVGLGALAIATCGLIHAARGLPTPPDWPQVFSAGGLVGYAAAYPLSMLLTVYVTVPLLVLLAIFGLLVVTATPVVAIPRRFAQAWRWLSGADDEDAEAAESLSDTEAGAAQKAGGARKRKARGRSEERRVGKTDRTRRGPAAERLKVRVMRSE